MDAIQFFIDSEEKRIFYNEWVQRKTYWFTIDIGINNTRRT